MVPVSSVPAPGVATLSDAVAVLSAFAVAALAVASAAVGFRFRTGLLRGALVPDALASSYANCPACGARTPADAAACEHCGDPLPDPAGETDDASGEGDAMDDGDDEATNCPACGARIPADDADCGHCGHGADEESDDWVEF